MTLDEGVIARNAVVIKHDAAVITIDAVIIRYDAAVVVMTGPSSMSRLTSTSKTALPS